MQITRQADYAVRAVVELARQPSRHRLTAKQIAVRWDIPVAFLSKTLGLLSDAGIVETQRGVKGGVQLSRSPASITLLEVVEAVDGPVSLNLCLQEPDSCPWTETCSIRPVWCTLKDEFRRRLAAFDFEQLATDPQAKPFGAVAGS